MAEISGAMPEGAHGGNIYKASKLYGIERGKFLDYSANINPLGLPYSLKELLKEELDNLVNYPDPECTELRQEISGYLGVGEDCVIIGNGASEVVFLLFDLLRLRRVLVPAPTFTEYAKAAQAYGTEVEYFELKEEENFRLDVSRLLSNMGAGIDAVFLCNPNNPTSTLVSKPDLLELLKHAAKRNIFVFIDEAFIEMTPDANQNSMVEFLSGYKNLFIVRAFTKIFAIPGLRLGYGLGDRELVKKMWERKLPWSVNSLACSMGKVLRTEKDYMEKTRAWIREEKQWFYNELRKLGKFKVFEPQTNFMLLKILVDGLNAPKLKHSMAVKGVLIRDAGNFKFLNDKFFRIAIKDRESNIRFLRVLNEVLEEIES